MRRETMMTVVAAAMISLAGCGGSDGVDGPKVKASQLVFNKSGPVALKAMSEGCLDTETKFLAENVEFEATDGSVLQSTNVQAALEELSLDLASVLVGEWQIMNILPAGEQSHEATGHVVFHNDGTFDLESGSFYVIGSGTIGGNNVNCGHMEEAQTFEKLASRTILFKYKDEAGESEIIAPTLISLTENQVAFSNVGGGCGVQGQQRISILTRVAE